MSLLLCAGSFASSHREAPLIANDPLADNVDLYAFRSPDNPDMVTIIATYVPMQLPFGGPNYYGFGENIRYEIHVDNNLAVNRDEIIYRFTFHRSNDDPTTFFNIRLGAENLRTTYTLERSTNGGVTFQTIVSEGVVPPNNIGARSIEGAAGLGTTYETLFQNAITTASTGENVFAGSVDDPFFVDLGGIFDLGDAPRQTGAPVDGLACLNVSALAIQVPISTLLKDGAPSEPTNILDSDYVIGVWASASRQAIRTIYADNENVHTGLWRQVSRLGMPLTNEVVIPIGQKDIWNSMTPYDELEDKNLDQYFYNPELALYMDDDQFGGAVPALAALRIQKNSLGAFDFSNGGDGLFSLKGSSAVAGTALDDDVFGTLLLPSAGKPRSVDLWPAFHTGVPNVAPYQLATGKGGDPLAVGKPFVNNFLPNGGDMLRLNMAVPPTQRDDPNFSSLGLIQAAVLGLTTAPYNETADLEFIPNMDGFPNGRRLEDDVTRIELQAVAGVVLAAIGLWYDDFDPESGNPVTEDLLNVITYTTGVEANDKEFTGSFPYLAMPTRGTDNCFAALFAGEDPIEPMVADTVATFFTSSNTSGMIGAFTVLDDGEIASTQVASAAEDADGIYYDEDSDVLYQLNRTDNVINAYNNFRESLDQGLDPELSATSTSDFVNGREIAAAGDLLVVAEDGNADNNMQNQLLVYEISATAITLRNAYNVDINLWGIYADVNTLFAIEDNSNRVAVFEDFFNNSETAITPDRSVTIEGLTRTHGISYLREGDIMILTDIADAMSDSDGGFTIIDDFYNKAEDGLIDSLEQQRVKGDSTQLGNPVDIALDMKNQLVYVVERAQSGGKLLVFSTTASGNTAPTSVAMFPGASAIYLIGSVTAEDPSTAVINVGSESFELNAFPNPANDVMMVQFRGSQDLYQGSHLELLSIDGKILKRQRVTSNNNELELEGVAAGIYFVKVQHDDFIHTIKVSKL